MLYTHTFGHGKPIVLVHGWAMHSGIWENFATELAKNFTVTCIDLPGHGRSPAIHPFELREVSDELVKAVVSNSSCWLGWSLGALFVLDIASRYPERVNSLVLLAGSPKFVQSPEKSWPGMKPEVLNAFAENLKTDCEATLLRFLSLQLMNSSEEKPLLKQLKTALSTYPAPSNDTLQGGLAILEQIDLRAQLAGLTIPTIAILGEKDTLIPVAVADKMQQLQQTLAINIIKNAGHVPFLSHEQAVLTIVRRLMNAD